MCDTFFVSDPSSQTKIFCKNSDRPYREGQGLIFLTPEKRFGKIRATYISIKAKHRKNSVFLGKPFWMWGAEFAINSNGVCIGNEALFTKVKIASNNGLLGMDVLRFASEVSEDSQSAAETITELIREYGQDANSAYDKDFKYHNSFLVMDFEKAFYIETVDRDVAIKEITGEKFFAVSNKMILCNDYDIFYGEKPCLKKYERKIFSFLAGGTQRRKKVTSKIKEKIKEGKITLKDCIDILKTHGFGTFSVCMHYKPLLCPSETANSVAVELFPDGKIIAWATGTPLPCLSLFKPFFFETGIPDQEFFIPTENSLWWYSFRFSRKILKNKSALEDYKIEINELQENLIKFSREVTSRKEKRELSSFALSKELEIKNKYSIINV